MTLKQRLPLVGVDNLSGPLGVRYHTNFDQGEEDLLVQFANAPPGMEARQRHTALEAHIKRFQWSSMQIIGVHGANFRDASIVDFIDKCDENEVFDRFNRVMFYGEGQAGYAALCYALAAPGAHVLAITPTQPETDQIHRYQPIADNLMAAGHITCIEDPALRNSFNFAGTEVNFVRSRFLSPGAEERIMQYGLMSSLLEDVMTGDVNPEPFYAYLRARRDHRGHIRRLASICLKNGHPARAATVIGSFAKRANNPRFKERFNALIKEYDLIQFQSL